MNILIVGGSSSLAQALKPELSMFAEVMTAGRNDCDIHLDLLDPIDKFAIPQGIDVVINTAAHFGGKEFSELLLAEETNVLGVLKLCRACSIAKVGHLVHVSTIFADLDDKSPFYNSYSLSKKHSEEIIELYCNIFELPLTVIRPSQIYGTGAAFRKHQPFFYNIIDRAENNEDIIFFGTNDALRNFIHVEDVAAATAMLVKRGILGTYTCMNVVNVSYSEIADAAISAFGSRSKVKFLKDRPDIPSNIFELDDTLFRLIDFFPQVTIEQGMKKEAAARKGRL